MTTVRTDRRLALATDASALGPLLGGALAAVVPAARWSSLRVTNALPAGDGDYALQYAVDTDRGAFLFGAVLPAGDAGRPQWVGPPGTAWLADPGLALSSPTADPRLAAAAHLLSPHGLRGLARTLGWGQPPAAEPQILAYRLGKRCVVRVQGGSDTAIVKIVRPSRLTNLAARFEALAAAPGVEVPRILHADPQSGVVAMTCAPGAGIDAIAGDAAGPAHEAAGRLLQAFHVPGGGRPAAWTTALELAQLTEWAGRTGGLLPEVEPGLAALVARLQCRVPDDGTVVRLHRDFYDKQVLVHGERTTLLDLDTMTTGDPAVDVGNYLAHVRLRAQQEPGLRADAAALAGRFLQGYGAGPELRHRALWWQAAALARLVVIYTLRPRWRNIVPRILEESATCLDHWEGNH